MERVNQPWGWLEPEVKRGEWVDAKKAGKPWPTKEQWADIRKLNAEKDVHRPECPMGQVGRISTLCACDVLAKAELAAKSEQWCDRCHNHAPDCRCPEEKRQWI